MLDRLITWLNAPLVLIMWIVAISPFVKHMVTDEAMTLRSLKVMDSFLGVLGQGIYLIGLIYVVNVLTHHIANLMTHVDVEARRSADMVATIFTKALRKEWRARRDKVDA